MNVRRQLYKQNRLKGMSAYRAAIEAGYTHATAKNATKNIDERMHFGDLMKAYRLEDDYLLEILKSGLQVVDENGKPNLTTKAFLEIALKLNKRLTERHEHTGKDGTPLPTPVINIYGSKPTNRSLHPSESFDRTGTTEQTV